MNEIENIINRHGAQAYYTTTASAAIEDAYRKTEDSLDRGSAILDNFALFGFEMVSFPDDKRWIKKLKLLQRKGHIDLSEYDLEDDVDLEYLFIRYVFMTPGDVIALGNLMGANKDDLKAALDLLA